MVVDLLSLGISFGELASKATNVRYQFCNSDLWVLSICVCPFSVFIEAFAFANIRRFLTRSICKRFVCVSFTSDATR